MDDNTDLAKYTCQNCSLKLLICEPALHRAATLHREFGVIRNIYLRFVSFVFNINWHFVVATSLTQVEFALRTSG